MKHILFFALFAIFAFQVQAHYPYSCQRIFNTDECSECQELMWRHLKNPGHCASSYNLGLEIYKVIKESGEMPEPYDLTVVEEGLNNYCNQSFHCSQDEAEEIYTEIQHVCNHELSNGIDWNNMNYNYSDITNYAAYEALLIYYTGIPLRNAVCMKSNHGGFCSFEFIEYINNWVKEATDSDPDVTVSHDLRYIIKGNGEKIAVPEHISCDPCWRKMAHICIDYFKEHRLMKSVEEQLWEPYEYLEELYLPQCTYHKRGLGQLMKARRGVSKLRRRAANPILGMLRVRDLVSKFKF